MIKLVKSSFYNEARTKKAVAEFVLKQDILSMSTECHKFEQDFAQKQKRKHAVYVANGSVANFLLIQSLLNLGHLRRNDKVGFSALTWPTNVMPLIQLGLKPVAIDCDLNSLNVSPEKLGGTIKKLRALFLTNLLGFCDDLQQIKKLCDMHNVILLEDNCEALGSKLNGKLLGNFGLSSTFSFFVGHHLSTIEGGMICTDDRQLYHSLLIARAHGWDRNLPPTVQTKMRRSSKVDSFYAKYTFYDLASNFRPTEINGFIGNTQLGYWDEIVNKREKNFNRFYKAMNQNDDFYHYSLSHMSLVSNFAMPIICKTPQLARQYRGKFEAADVEIRPVVAGNMTRQPFYKKYIGAQASLPNADLVHSNGFYFGNNPEMTETEVNKLCKLLVK